MNLSLKIIFIALISFTSFTNTVNAQEKIINASDYGLVEGSDAIPAIRSALQACKTENATKLIIPKGKYNFYSAKATEEYVRVSNNDNSMKRIAFPLKGFADLEIDANGAEFVMHGHMLPFNVEYSENITLKNFSIDWNKPFNFQGEVIAVNEKSNSFDLKVHHECDYEIIANELVFIEKANKAIKPWKQWAFPVEDEYGWEQSIDWNIWYDSKNKAPAYDHEKYILHSFNEKLNQRYKAEEIEKGVVRFYNAADNLPPVGWVLVVKGRKQKNRLSPAIHLFHNKNVKFENVTVHHAAGMGLIGERCENVTLDGFNVLLPEGKDRYITTTADATHFVNCKGLIKYNNCHFENMLDDAANFHGIYVKIEDLVDDYTIGVKRMHGQQTGFQFAEKGDSIRLSNNKTMEGYATLKVVEATDHNEEYMTIRFDKKVNEILQKNSVADNISWQTDVEFKNSSVRRNRARSILVSTAGNVLIENNDFSECTHISMLFEGDAQFWYESGPVKNVVIRNNHFKDFGLGAGYGPLVQITPRVEFKGKPTSYYHKNIYFENNTIEAFTRLVIRAESVENMVFRNNTIKQSTSYPYLELATDKDAFVFKNSKNINVEKNNFLMKEKANIVKQQCEKVNIKRNKGIK